MYAKAHLLKSVIAAGLTALTCSTLAIPEAHAIVICQGKKGKIALRATGCKPKETQVRLGSDSVDLPAPLPGLPTPPTCDFSEVLTWEGKAFECVEPGDGEIGSLSCETVGDELVRHVSEAGNLFVTSPPCPEGFELTGGGFDVVNGAPPTGFSFEGSRVHLDDPTRWRCSFVNPADATVDIICVARCCQVSE